MPFDLFGPPVKVEIGDCLAVMQRMENESVNSIITSPPYFALRDYGHPGQLGHERTPQEYIDRLVTIFREARRVLRNDGTFWLVIGDCYAVNHSGSVGASTLMGSQKQQDAYRKRPVRDVGLPLKSLLGIPWRVALALQSDGWILRDDNIWSKPNPMPESVKDRCTRAHEYVFMFVKSSRYYYNKKAIEEPSVYFGKRDTITQKEYRERGGTKGVIPGTTKSSFRVIPEFRNKRSVWTVPTASYRGKHCAVYPPDLIVPCVIAGTPPRGVILDPFAGSGTTGMVAASLGREAFLIEINPDNLPEITQRLSGQKPKRVRDKQAAMSGRNNRYVGFNQRYHGSGKP